MIREGGNRKRSFEEGRSGLTDELTFPTIPQNQLTDEPIILEGIIEGNQVRRILVDGGSSSEIMRNTSSLGVIDLRVTMGRAGRSKTVLMEFAIINCCSPYNVIIGRTRMRSLKAVARKDARFKERGPVSLEKTWDKEDIEEVCIISHERPDQHITMGTTLIADCKKLLTKVLRENIEVFAWARSERTVVLRFVMEHQLNIYPFAEPVIHKRRPMTPNGRLVLKEEVFRWLKEGMIRKVRHPMWVANTILVKLENGTWKVQMDYSSLNKVCAKDMYPFPEEREGLASIMGYPYKCFLRLPKEYSQIRITKDDE
ncbi:hypothetical protein Tco_0260822 [Tanacetum coccineum]